MKITESTSIVMIEVEGPLEDILTEVFRKRVSPMLDQCPERPVRLVVTTRPQNFRGGREEGEPFFESAAGGRRPEFTWKSAGPLYEAAHQFRVNFLGSLAAAALGSYVLFGIYRTDIEPPARLQPIHEEPPESEVESAEDDGPESGWLERDGAEIEAGAEIETGGEAVGGNHKVGLECGTPLEATPDGGTPELACGGDGEGSEAVSCSPDADPQGGELPSSPEARGCTEPGADPHEHAPAAGADRPSRHAVNAVLRRRAPYAHPSALMVSTVDEESNVTLFSPGVLEPSLPVEIAADEDAAPREFIFEPEFAEPEADAEGEKVALAETALPRSANGVKPHATPDAERQPETGKMRQPDLGPGEAEGEGEGDGEGEGVEHGHAHGHEPTKVGTTNEDRLKTGPPNEELRESRTRYEEIPPEGGTPEQETRASRACHNGDESDNIPHSAFRISHLNNPQSAIRNPQFLDADGRPYFEPLTLVAVARPAERADAKGLPANAYQEFFGLAALPFNNTPDPVFFYPDRRHEAALARMIQAIAERKGMMLVTGEAGCGKSTLCHELLTRLPGTVRAALVTHTLGSPTQLLRAIAEGLGLEAQGLGRYDLLQLLGRTLAEALAAGDVVCIIIDECQGLDREMLETVRALGDLETEREKLAQIILLGDSEMRRRVARPALTRLRQRVAVQVHLEPLTATETAQYIRHRLRHAAPARPLIFELRAMQEAHRFSGGVPRLINTVCDGALLGAFRRDDYRVGVGLIRQAARDLDLKPRYGRLAGLLKSWRGRG